MLQDACIGPRYRHARGSVFHPRCGSLGVLYQSNITGLTDQWPIVACGKT